MMKLPFQSFPIIAALVLALSACASGPGSKTSTSAAPEIRAVERWNHLIARKAEQAYDYLSPGKREVETRDAFAQRMNNRPVRWDKVIFMKKACDKPESCIVTLQLDISVPVAGMGGMSASLTFVEETWIRDKDGKWYYLGAASTRKS